MKYPCIETTIEFNLGDWEFRLWIDRNDLENLNIHDGKIYQKAESFYRFNKPDRKAMLEYIIENTPRLNAIQLRDINKGYTMPISGIPQEVPTRNGVVVYLVEFSSDIHG